MKKCKFCALQEAKPCYECNECMGGDNHFKPWPKPQENACKPKANELYFSKHPERKTFELEEIKR